jgi:hypothetical protein
MRRPLVPLIAAAALIAGCNGVAGDNAITHWSGTFTQTIPTSVPRETAGSNESQTPDATSAAFKDITLKGKGKKIAKFSIPEEAAAIAVVTHKGKSNFIVDTIDATGDTVDGLVNAIGNYSGTVLFDLDEDHHSVAFRIDADGAWTITVKPITSAKTWNPKTAFKGTGDNVYWLVPASSGLVTLDLAYKGKDNFIVESYSADGSGGLANEIGNFKGQVLLPDGTILLEVDADEGTWAMTPG